MCLCVCSGREHFWNNFQLKQLRNVHDTRYCIHISDWILRLRAFLCCITDDFGFVTICRWVNEMSPLRHRIRRHFVSTRNRLRQEWRGVGADMCDIIGYEGIIANIYSQFDSVFYGFLLRFAPTHTHTKYLQTCHSLKPFGAIKPKRNWIKWMGSGNCMHFVSHSSMNCVCSKHFCTELKCKWKIIRRL